MTRISIPGSVTERDALLMNAEQNSRQPREQAHVLLLDALCLLPQVQATIRQQSDNNPTTTHAMK